MTGDYTIVLVPLDPEDGTGFVGIVPDLPGCMGDGETESEALEDTKAAISEWLATNAAMGRANPVPGMAAERMQRRDTALLEALRAALDVMDQQDGKILDLERKVEVLYRLMQDESIPRRIVNISYGAKKALPKTH